MPWSESSKKALIEAEGYKRCVMDQAACHGLTLVPADSMTYYVKERPGGLPAADHNMQVNTFDGKRWEVRFVGKWYPFEHLGDALLNDASRTSTDA